MMKYFDYFKNIFPIYLISSILLGITISSLIVIHRYADYLANTLVTVRSLSSNKDKIKIQINKMDEWKKYLKDDLRLDADDTYLEMLMFQTLDDIKTNIKGASITVATFEKSGEEKGLPVRITVPVKNYKMIVDYVGYIESLSMPRYKVNRLSISIGSGGDFILNIDGSLRVPSVGT